MLRNKIPMCISLVLKFTPDTPARSLRSRGRSPLFGLPPITFLERRFTKNDELASEQEDPYFPAENYPSPGSGYRCPLARPARCWSGCMTPLPRPSGRTVGLARQNLLFGQGFLPVSPPKKKLHQEKGGCVKERAREKGAYSIWERLFRARLGD